MPDNFAHYISSVSFLFCKLVPSHKTCNQCHVLPTQHHLHAPRSLSCRRSPGLESRCQRPVCHPMYKSSCGTLLDLLCLSRSLEFKKVVRPRIKSNDECSFPQSVHHSAGCCLHPLLCHRLLSPAIEPLYSCPIHNSTHHFHINLSQAFLHLHPVAPALMSQYQ